MAISPEKKAEVCADLIGGLSCAKAALKHGVGKATVVAWLQELKEAGLFAKKKPTDQNRPKPEKTDQPTNKAPTKSDQDEGMPQVRVLSREERFMMKLEELLFETMNMDTAIARACSDAEFIRHKPEGVHVLSEAIRRRADTLVSFIGGGSPALPAGDPGSGV